ncbi:MAG TPA: methyltransferase domain-containing protein [Solirubrobacterales bacterium]|nr:methyltransferase domain-containing protein [Solirubrobacterales bacterium]
MSGIPPKPGAPGHRPPPISQWQGEFEKKVAQEFERRTGLDYKETVALIINAIDPFPGMQVLDVATGTGVIARQMVRLVGEKGRIVGVDGTDKMIEQARLAAQSAGLGRRIEWKVAKAEKLPFATESFDLITCVLAFHLLQAEQFLEQAWRVLKPGGRLLLAHELAPRGGLSPLRLTARRNYYQFIARDPGEAGAHFYSADEMVAMLLAAGFRQYVVRGLREPNKFELSFSLITAGK